MPFQEICARQWEVQLLHMYRKVNCIADYLSNFGHFLVVDLHFLTRLIGSVTLTER
ncbi:hypothetical protein LINGRAHAP2_LOCUS34102 [Linum grandiflorum]